MISTALIVYRSLHSALNGISNILLQVTIELSFELMKVILLQGMSLPFRVLVVLFNIFRCEIILHEYILHEYGIFYMSIFFYYYTSIFFS